MTSGPEEVSPAHRRGGIHPAAEAFGPAAAAYERGRPEYPQAAVEWLVRRIGADHGSRVVDLAAGTGKLTRLIRPLVSEVIAVEPVAGMRDELRRHTTGVEVLDGTAEAMPLADASVDAVVVGQAFHWFDGPGALAEIHRVLRPAGGLGLIWNRRNLKEPLNAKINELIREYRGSAPAHERDAWRQAFEERRDFTPLEEFKMPFEQEVSPDALLDRVGSTSFIAGLPDPQRISLLEHIRNLVPPTVSRVRLEYTTTAFACRSR